MAKLTYDELVDVLTSSYELINQYLKEEPAKYKDAKLVTIQEDLRKAVQGFEKKKIKIKTWSCNFEDFPFEKAEISSKHGNDIV